MKFTCNHFFALGPLCGELKFQINFKTTIPVVMLNLKTKNLGCDFIDVLSSVKSYIILEKHYYKQISRNFRETLL